MQVIFIICLKVMNGGGSGDFYFKFLSDDQVGSGFEN